MQEKKGFTLVELIAVISILAILLIIAVPTIITARNNALKGLDKEQRRNIQEAGKMLGVDLDDYLTDVYNCSASWISTCNKDDKGKWTSVEVTIEDLKTHNYFTDEANQCSGTIIVNRKGVDNTYKVDLESSVKCK